MSTPVQNGSNFLSYKWLVGILVSILILIGGSFARSISAEVGELRRSDARQDAQTEAVFKRLDSIETKLDRVLGIK